MPEFTEHERARFHAMARQQIRFVTLAPTVEAASNRRFLAQGYLLAMAEVEAWPMATAQLLEDELVIATHGQIDELMQQTLLDTLAPEPVHCTGHVDYDPDSRLPATEPNISSATKDPAP
jgi:hypothetical protein